MARIDSVHALRAILGPSKPTTFAKILPRVEPQGAEFLRVCPFAVISTVDAQGVVESSPKGDLPGFPRNFSHSSSRACRPAFQDQWRSNPLFCGSGVIEGGCKSLIGQRLKESGMFWTAAGATSVLNLRLALKSNRWDECWARLNHSNYLKVKRAA